MKTLGGRQYSFQQVTQFLLEDKVQNTPASNTLYYAMRYKCFSISSEEGIFQRLTDTPVQNSFRSQAFL
jgi:hypothetical protein